jgi:hypothetical protein
VAGHRAIIQADGGGGIVVLVLFLFASYNGALIVFLTEIMPTEVRIAGFSLVHSSATAIFGGFTPAI